MSPRQLAALALLAGCGFDPPAEEVITPPPVYREWFAQVEQCAERRADFDRITWCAADLGGVLGYRQADRIWIHRDWLDSRGVVAHEELHFILDGDPHHTRPEWKRCGL